MSHSHCYTLQHTATHCNTLQHTATHCNVALVVSACVWENERTRDWLLAVRARAIVVISLARHVGSVYTLQHTATYCNTMQHTTTLPWWVLYVCERKGEQESDCEASGKCIHSATHCNTLQHTATHCNTLQHTATYCNTFQHTATHCNTLQHTAMSPWWALYVCVRKGERESDYEASGKCIHTATHCNTLQHTATHCNTLQRRPGGSVCVREKGRCNTLQHAATHCSTMPRTAISPYWALYVCERKGERTQLLILWGGFG